MMAFQEEEQEEFFDSREDILPVPNSLQENESCFHWPGNDPLHQVWISRPASVRDRREKFLRLMGFQYQVSVRHLLSGNVDGELTADDKFTPDIDRFMSDEGAALRSSSEGSVLRGSWDGSNRTDPSRWDSSRIIPVDDLKRSLDPPSFARQDLHRKVSASDNFDKKVRRRKGRRRRRIGWLRRLGVVSCIVNRQWEESELSPSDSHNSGNARAPRVKVIPHRKRLKEFSAVYKGQGIKAHDGAILTMKFSPDGQHLASGGEDGLVRVWRVMKCERTDEDDVFADDPSSTYLTVNHNSGLVPVCVNSQKKGKSGTMKRTSDSACVVIPHDVFRISDEPLHTFRGHDGEVLDLSWSKNKYLLSSSTDKTVRLWKMGCDNCLKIFSHNNYVTCIQINPADETYFISGSIDGKVRIWQIPGCQVVDWTDIQEIVTAVCYHPDGKGVVVGSMNGDCHFYDATDNHLEHNAQISLQGKKKFPYRRITGFQFFPADHQKLMVTSADSQVRILDGVDVIHKYKGMKSSSLEIMSFKSRAGTHRPLDVVSPLPGLQNAGCQISASFTPDGRHIILASEDSNVYIWTHANQDVLTSNQVKRTWSFERFFSCNASVAIAWNGLEPRGPASATSVIHPQQKEAFRDPMEGHERDLTPSGSFALSQEFFPQFLPKGTETWPEEKLPSRLMNASSLSKSQYKFLRSSCQSTSQAWGQVIVTAGYDGRINSFQNYGLPVHL